jgi:membrane protein
MAGAGTEETAGRMSAGAWLSLARRTWTEASHDNVGLIAAGVGFYGFLALVPLLGATVLTYGLFADASDVAKHVGALFSVLPRDAATLIGDTLDSVVKSSAGKKGLGLLVALGLALFGARNAAGAIITALNVAYEKEETRGFLRVNLLALGITAAGVGTFVVGAMAVAAFKYLHLVAPRAGTALSVLSKVGSSILLALLAATGAAALSYFGPAGGDSRWRWLTPGSILFAVTWVVLTAGFGVYVSNFGHYGATYGSLGAVVGFITWIWLSSTVVLIGAQLNAEMEKQTARDTTTGPEQPLGTRRAAPADRVAAQRSRSNTHQSSVLANIGASQRKTR